MDDENDYSISHLESHSCCPFRDETSGSFGEGEYIRFNPSRTAILNTKYIYDGSYDGINTLSYNLTNPFDFKINIKEPLFVSDPVFYPGHYNSILE